MTLVFFYVHIMQKHMLAKQLRVFYARLTLLLN